jgi:hypothetical protein
VRIRQKIADEQIDDVSAATRSQLESLGLDRRMRPGHTVAITAGSRGIRDQRVILKEIVAHFHRLGAEPFLVPAMGSHGGATAAGQREVLRGFGIEESSIGCPVRASMETVPLDEIILDEFGTLPVHFDRLAFEADHVFLFNRVKPHTRFAGPIQSGLLKMMMIGLGKAEGARLYHRAVSNDRFSEVIRQVAQRLFERVSVLGGLAVVENARERTSHIEAILPENFLSREEALLAMARRQMATLPFAAIDLLLIDRIGKEISGTGMDANVIGRKFDDHKATGSETPRVEAIALRGLTEKTAGNANGVGMAEFCRSDLLVAMDVEKTRINAITANHVPAAMLPLDYPTDREMLQAAVKSLGLPPASELKFVWIADTLHLQEMVCSPACLDRGVDETQLEPIGGAKPLPFDASGNLPDSVARFGAA